MPNLTNVLWVKLNGEVSGKGTSNWGQFEMNLDVQLCPKAPKCQVTKHKECYRAGTYLTRQFCKNLIAIFWHAAIFLTVLQKWRKFWRNVRFSQGRRLQANFLQGELIYIVRLYLSSFLESRISVIFPVEISMQTKWQCMVEGFHSISITS